MNWSDTYKKVLILLDEINEADMDDKELIVNNLKDSIKLLKEQLKDES